MLLDGRALTIKDIGSDFSNQETEVTLEDCGGFKEGSNFTTKNRADIHTFDLIGTLNTHFALLFGHCFEMV